MFDKTFSFSKIKASFTEEDKLPFSYKKRALLMWEEHCVECAPPQCYHNCPIFLEREDKKCKRLQYGLQKTYERKGSLDYGIDCEFRKWAKLEARYNGEFVSDSKYIKQERTNEILSSLFVSLARGLKWIWPSLKPYGAYVAYRRHLFHGVKDTPDLFYIKCYLKEDRNVQIQVQIESNTILLSEIYQIVPGENEIKIPISSVLKDVSNAKIFITPLNEDSNVRILFSWIDIFSGVSYAIEEKPSEKIKVVAWDLDNTLWKGTLIEADDVIINEKAVTVIKALDERGILNTISSKNDFDHAMAKLKQFGIDQFFICPAINWGQKSQNLLSIAKTLNLGINSFALVDDNIREREEIAFSLPMVRVYSDEEIGQLLSYPEFDVPVTEMSKKRRESYLQENQRKIFREQFSDDYDSYLKSLQMILQVEEVDSTNKERCFELLSRSNQLNLSTNRYSLEEYNSLLNRENMHCYAYRCSDRFGDYGIIAFLSVCIEGDKARIVDFVISCRVAKKKIENAIITSLAKTCAKIQISTIEAKLILTKKNGPLAAVFTELPFSKVSEDAKSIFYRLDNLKGMSEIDYLTTIEKLNK